MGVGKGILEYLTKGRGLEELRFGKVDTAKSKRLGETTLRGGELERLQNLETGVERFNTNTPDQLSIVDFEGKPFITTMSDRTDAGGRLVDINGVPLNRPVDLLGGQDYMFNNDDHVWASAKSALSGILNLGRHMKGDKKGQMGLGENPLLMPWRMAPTGSDFASMTGETMLSFAQSNMGKSEKKALDKMIKGSIPDWKGIDSPESIQQFQNAPDKIRKKLKSDMDTQFRNEGGLSLAEARLAIAQPSQVNAREGGLQNVARVDLDRGIGVNRRHPSYPFYISGEPLGTLKEDIPAYMLFPNSLKQLKGLDPQRIIEDRMAPTQEDLRSLQMGARGGVITEDVLRGLQKAGIISSPSVVGGMSLLDAIQQENAQAELDNLMGQYNQLMDRNNEAYNYGELVPLKRSQTGRQGSAAMGAVPVVGKALQAAGYDFSVPTMVDDIVKGLLDIGQSRKTGVVNSNTSLLDALL